MAGSYRHATTKNGKLRNNETFTDMVENLGDAYETVEEMYGMIWWLADGNAEMVEQARQNYLAGITQKSPGRQR